MSHDVKKRIYSKYQKMKTALLITGLLILLFANIIMLKYAPRGLVGYRENFQSYSLGEAGGAKNDYKAMGAYDGVKLSTGNNVSGWRYTAPNEPLKGAAFAPGQDSLFMFKNNQCKPECCGSSFSCDGGCVCTTPEQRQYIAGRGGNRTTPEDSL